MKKRLLQAITALALLVTASNTYAQVTIGSNETPRAGALLDLNEGSTTTRGLNLPRVELTNLKPTTPEELSASIGGTGGWVLNDHTALVVYNTQDKEECPPLESIYKGIYIFDGEQWQFLGQKGSSIPLAPSNESEWGTQVLRHAAKAGVYEEFVSADFDTAGRWMITNFTATSYDGISHSQGKSLTGPISMPSSYTEAHWSYPSATSPITATEYTTNPDLGYLYTWSAATAGKGGSDGMQNATEEGTSDTYTKVQGVCPAGWHLPSDYEWTELENEFIRNTTKYANVATDIDNSGASDLPQDFTSGWRGSTHGNAMKNLCEPFLGNANQGNSKQLSDGGFNTLLAGYATSSSINYGKYMFFWSSSSSTGYNSWARGLHRGYSTVERAAIQRTFSLSVRCKKD